MQGLRIADPPLRITFVLPHLRAKPIGGYRIIYEYASRLASRGHDITLVHPIYLAEGSAVQHFARRSEWRERRARRSGAPIIPWFTFPAGVNVRIVRKLSHEVFPDADVLIATAWRTAGCVSAAPIRKGRKLYLIQHYETWDASRDKVDATWRLPLHKVVISKWLADIAAGMGESERTTYIPNGMDFQQFSLVVPYGAREPHRVGMLTHSKEWKGTPDGIAALERARRVVPDLTVTLFGTGARPPDAPAWMEYRENLTGDSLTSLYNELAIFLHASWAEGWPLPPAEAMACGCAVVATDNPGVLDYVEHERTAVVAPRRDRDALGDAVIRMLSDDNLRETLAAAGHDAIQFYTWRRATDAMEDLLSASARGLHPLSKELGEPRR